MVKGGRRIGAGRPSGQGMYGEPTITVRVPKSLANEVKLFATSRGFKIPLYSSRVQAGLPSAADDHIEENIDLISYLIKDASNTYLVRAAGYSMIGAGIRDGDLLIVDRSITPVSGKTVIAEIDGQLTVKTLSIRDHKAFLTPANPEFPEIAVDEEKGVSILGVVTSSIQLH